MIVHAILILVILRSNSIFPCGPIDLVSGSVDLALRSRLGEGVPINDRMILLGSRHSAPSPILILYGAGLRSD